MNVPHLIQNFFIERKMVEEERNVLSNHLLVVALVQSRLSYNANFSVVFPFFRIFGFVGYIRICVKEHTILNSRAENVAPDVRLLSYFS